MSSEPRGRDGESRGGGILWALGISAVLHLLIFLLTLWIPLDSLSSATPVPEEETAVTFRFDAPTPEPETEAPPPSPEPEPEPEPEPQAPQPEAESLLRPEPADGVGPPTDTPGAPEEAAEEILDAPVEEPIEQDPTAEAETADEPTPQPIRRPEPRRLDIGRALRDFDSSLRERPVTPDAAEPRNPSPQSRFRPDVPALTGSAGFGSLEFESTDFDWSDYARQIIQILERAVNQRIYVTLDDFERWAHENRNYLIRPDQLVRARFVIERSGEIVGIALEGSSQVIPLDAAVLDGLDEALLPLPDDFPRDREVVHIVALFPRGAQIRQLRPSYNAMKRMGWF